MSGRRFVPRDRGLLDRPQERGHQRAWHAGELRYALANDELALEYQPIVALGSDRLAAVEALLRWDHPEHGRIPPDHFIPVAEQIGLIEEIGTWVLGCACHDAARWHRASPLKPSLVVSVNVSPHQFRPDLCDTVRGVLADTGLAADQLRLEITESSVMQDIERAIDVLDGIKRLGVRLSMDDFGTGYSSLSYLHRLPVDQIKADRSFIGHLTTGDGDAAIVAAIVSLAGALGLEVVAEGVETDDQLGLLRELGYDYVQGYLLARPQPAASVQRLIADAADGARLVGAASTTVRESARRSVVIADDSADVLQLTSMSLSAAGFTVHAASCGTEAVRIASEVVPDCVVLDVHMPDISGYEVLRQLRAQPSTRHCVIIMLTAAAAAEDKVTAFSLGADDYIVKPFSPRDLVGRVSAALRRNGSPRP